MTDHSEIHRGHFVIAGASGPSLAEGPLVAFYSVWKVEENNSYQAVLQGMLPGVFTSMESAYAATITEAKAALDRVLDANIS